MGSVDDLAPGAPAGLTVAAVDWTEFCVAFRAPFATAHGVETARRGLIVRVRLDDGTLGLGEASPLPSFGGGDLDAALVALAAAAPRVVGRRPDAALAGVDRLSSAAARFALETGLLDALGRALGVRIADLLAASATAPATEVAVNATIGGDDAAAAARAAARAVAAGFRTVKLKVGLAPSVAAEVDRVGAVRDAIGPRARLRLDANESWDAATAVAVLRACAPLDLELVEQPVRADDLAGLAAVRRAVSVPIAADEAVRDEAAARALLAAEAADLLVVKPTIVGGLRAGRRIADLCAAHGRAAIVTSALEAGVGVVASLHLAASLGAAPGRPAHGLATGGLLTTDLLVDSPAVRAGAIALPAGSGLGVALDEAALARRALVDEGAVGQC